jgi:hypothetical protein
MPLRNKKARQAKAQRVQGKKFIKKGFINNLAFQNDPNWVNEGDSDIESESEGVTEREMPDLANVSDSEDEIKDTVEVRNAEGHGGVKRKILRATEGFWKKQISEVSYGEL